MNLAGDSSINKVLSLLTDVKESSSGWTAQCPAHKDKDPSLSIKVADDGRILLNCFADCTFESVVESIGLTPKDLAPNATLNEQGNFVADTDYCPIRAVCQVKRMPYEAFMAFEPTEGERGKWRVARVPVYDETGEKHSYFDICAAPDSGKLRKGLFPKGKGSSGMFFPGKLPQPDETWYLVEGVKDAAALVGLGFNAAGMPTSQLNKKYSHLFRDCSMVLVPDLDEAGVKGADTSASRLFRIAKSVSIIRMPGEVKGSGGDDVRDVLAKPDGEKSLREAIDAADTWKPKDTDKKKDRDVSYAESMAILLEVGQHYAKDASRRLLHFRDGFYQYGAEESVKERIRTLTKLGFESEKWTPGNANATSLSSFLLAPHRLDDRPPLDRIEFRERHLAPFGSKTVTSRSGHCAAVFNYRLGMIHLQLAQILIGSSWTRFQPTRLRDWPMNCWVG